MNIYSKTVNGAGKPLTHCHFPENAWEIWLKELPELVGWRNYLFYNWNKQTLLVSGRASGLVFNCHLAFFLKVCQAHATCTNPTELDFFIHRENWFETFRKIERELHHVHNSYTCISHKVPSCSPIATVWGGAHGGCPPPFCWTSWPLIYLC